MSETVKNTETQKKPKKVLKTIFNTIINILIVVVLVVSLLIAVMALTSKANGGVSTVFGYTVQPIQSDSMKGGSPDGYASGDFETGDLMIAKATDFDDLAVYNLGDIVTFRSRDTDGNIMLIVHRIVDVVKDDNGTYRYQTQGDNRETSSVPDQKEVVDYLKAYDIASVFYTSDYEGMILKGWGAPLDYLRTQQGFFFVVLLPMIIFFLYALVRVVLSTMNYKSSKAEDEKKEAVEAAVAAALAGKGVEEMPLPDGVTPEQMEQFKQFIEFQKMQNAAAESKPAEESAEKSAEESAEKLAETPENNE